MRLSPWRGTNVLVTDATGTPVLLLDGRGNVVEWPGVGVREPAAPPSAEALARNIADWIRWTADEPGEFNGCDIHPELRDRVRELVPDCVG